MWIDSSLSNMKLFDVLNMLNQGNFNRNDHFWMYIVVIPMLLLLLCCNSDISPLQLFCEVKQKNSIEIPSEFVNIHSVAIVNDWISISNDLMTVYFLWFWVSAFTETNIVTRTILLLILFTIRHFYLIWICICLCHKGFPLSLSDWRTVHDIQTKTSCMHWRFSFSKKFQVNVFACVTTRKWLNLNDMNALDWNVQTCYLCNVKLNSLSWWRL